MMIRLGLFSDLLCPHVIRSSAENGSVITPSTFKEEL